MAPHKSLMEDLADQEALSDDDDTQAGKRKIKRWTSSEHDLLVRLVEQLGEDACWATIAAHIPGRSGKQCRERWVNHIGADIKKGGWTQDEESQVARLHATIGPAWTRIANALGGRTENSVKNHFNALLRSKRLEDKKTSILAQYVRIVRDKLYTGTTAYDQAIRLTQEAMGSASQGTSSNPSSKGRGQKASQQGSHASVADGRSTGHHTGISNPSTGPAAIRTRFADSPSNPSYSSAGGMGGPMNVGTPMSGLAMGDATAALAAAVAAVNAAAKAVAGVPGTGGQQFSTGGPVMSDGMTESLQYSGGSPGVLGSVPAQSGSMSASLGMADDGSGIVRGMRRTGRGGRGRPGYGHMPTLRDARSGGTPNAQAAQQAAANDFLEHTAPWQTGSPSGAAGSEASHQATPGGAAVSGSKGRSASHLTGGGQNGWLAGSGLAGAPLSVLHGMAPNAFDGSMPLMALPSQPFNPSPSLAGLQLAPSLHDHMGQLPGAGGGGGGLAHHDSMGLHADSLKTLNSLLLHQNSWVPPQFGQDAPDNNKAPNTNTVTFLQHHPPNNTHAGASGASTPAAKPTNATNTRSQSRARNAADTPPTGTTPPLGTTSPSPTTPTEALVLDPSGAAGGASANSLTLGMHDLVGHSGFSVFGNQHNVDIGSPLSPASRMQGRISGPLGVPLFSQFPTHTSFNALDSMHPTEHQEPLMGRLSGLSLDAMLASPASARTPSASALYFIQGASMRQSRGDGLISGSQVSHPQILLSPFHNQDKERGNSKPQHDLHLSGHILPTPAPHNRHNNPGAGGTTTDDLGLVMRPLHVKTRKGQGSEAMGTSHGMIQMHGTDASGAVHMTTLTPTRGSIPGSYMGASGTMLMSENGTPTRAMLGEVFLTWTQEPCTPSNMITGSPSYPVMQVIPGPLMSNPHHIGMGGGPDSMFPPHPNSFLHIHSEDNTPREGPLLPQISVPAADVMGCLDIVFDDSDPPEPPTRPDQQQQQQGWQGGAQGVRVKLEPVGDGVRNAADQRSEAGIGTQPGRRSPALPTGPPNLFTKGLSNGQLAQLPPTPQPWPTATANKRTATQAWNDPYPNSGSPVQAGPKRPNQNGALTGLDGPGTQPSSDSVATPVLLPGSPMVEQPARGSLPWAVNGAPAKQGGSSDSTRVQQQQQQQQQLRTSKLQVASGAGGMQDTGSFGPGMGRAANMMLPGIDVVGRAEQQALHSPV